MVDKYLVLGKAFPSQEFKAIRIKVIPGKFNPFIKEYHHYYHVLIFDHKEEMWAYGSQLSCCHRDDGYDAITIPTYRQRFVDNKWVIAPKIGTVLFHKNRLGSSVISHEAVHMATSYLRITNKLQLSDEIDDEEEKLAYCVGSCTRQIVDTWYRVDLMKSKGRNWNVVSIKAPINRNPQA